VQGGNKGMYSSSEASVSRADSPVIFVVGDKTRQPESYAAVSLQLYHSQWFDHNYKKNPMTLFLMVVNSIIGHQ